MSILNELLGNYSLIRNETLYGIADAIREKTGTSDGIFASEMRPTILSIVTGTGEVETPSASINGFKFVSGTFSFEEDQTSDVIIDHEDVGEIKAILVWCENPTTESVAYKVLSFYIPTDGTSRWNNSGSIYFSTAGGMTFGNSASAIAHAIINSSQTRFRIGSNVDSIGARILGGKTYHWIVLGGG